MSAEYERRKYARSSSCDLTASRAVEVRREARVERGELAEPCARRPRAPAAPPGLPRTAPVRVGAQALQPVGVGEDLPRRRELLVFAGLRRRRVDLGELERQELGARGLLALARRAAGSRSVASPLPARERRRRRAARSASRPGELVEQVEVRGRIEQDLVLVLAVQIDERRRTGRAARALVTSAPSTNARLRPCAETSRRTIISRPSGVSKMASTAAVSSPVRTRSAEARPPTSRPTAPTRMDLPAPVSPVSTLRPRLELELEAIDDGEMADARESAAWRS